MRILKKAGFEKWRRKGSHLTLYREIDRHALTLPVHTSKTFPKGTADAIINQAGLTVEEFVSLC